MKPWYVGSQNDGLCVVDQKPSPSGTDVVWEGPADLEHICCVNGDTHQVRLERANLIAAAPELLEALNAVLDIIHRLGGCSIRDCSTCRENASVVHKIKEAVAKAEGKDGI